MCDYSLQSVASRPAKIGDKLKVRNFGTGTRGFCDLKDKDVAVCILPGTELAFEEPARTAGHWQGLLGGKAFAAVAIFRQINKQAVAAHHDALEFPNGDTILLTALDEGQMATVLQLPAMNTQHEIEQAKRLAYTGS
jgi:hypothetical protein